MPQAKPFDINAGETACITVTVTRVSPAVGNAGDYNVFYDRHDNNDQVVIIVHNPGSIMSFELDASTAQSIVFTGMTTTHNGTPTFCIRDKGRTLVWDDTDNASKEDDFRMSLLLSDNGKPISHDPQVHNKPK